MTGRGKTRLLLRILQHQLIRTPEGQFPKRIFGRLVNGNLITPMPVPCTRTLNLCRDGRRTYTIGFHRGRVIFLL